MTNDNELSQTRKKWIAAAAVLARDPSAKVRCPVCDSEYLAVTDIPYELDAEHFSRMMKCPNCGATEVMDRLRAEPSR